MINDERLKRNFLEITALEGVSRNESGAMNEIKKRLDRLGVEYAQDSAGEKFAGDCGNVIARIPGTADGEGFFLAAHVDTIASSAGKPYIRDGVFYSDGKTVLGADDRAGVAVMLEVTETLLNSDVSYPDIELVFLVGEEIGLYGSRFLDYSLLNSKYGFVIDSSADLGKVVSHAPDHHSCAITVTGKPAHAAIAPELGIHAIKMAAEGIYKTDIGRVSDNSTMSIGVISGGTKTNVVPEKVEIMGEIRSLDSTEIPGLKERFERPFKEAAETYGGTVSFEWEEEYGGFNIKPESPFSLRVAAGYRACGIEPEFIKFVGGSDANNFNARGLPTFNLGQGYKKNHSNEEYLKVDDLLGIARVVIELAKGAVRT